MSLIQYRDSKRIEWEFDRWIESIGPRYWITFTYNGHSISEERLHRWLHGKGNTQMSLQILHDKKEVSKTLEEGRKAVYNHLKRFSIKTRSHNLVISAGGLQPIGNRPHFHLVMKPDRKIDYSDIRNELIGRWRILNGSSSADVRIFNEMYHGEEYRQIRTAFLNHWDEIMSEDTSSNKKDLLKYRNELKRKSIGGYMMKHPEEFIEVFCPKRSVRCKKGDCKQGRLFN